MIKKLGHENFHSIYKIDANQQISFIKLPGALGSGMNGEDVNRAIKFNCLPWLASEGNTNNWFKTQHGSLAKAWALDERVISLNNLCKTVVL